MLRIIIPVVIGAAVLVLVVGFARSLYVQYRQQPLLFKYHLLHVMLWTLAIGSLSGCLATFRRLSGEQPNLHPALNLAVGMLYVVLLAVSFVVLGFFMYREDSRTGKLRRRLALYDLFIPQHQV